MPARTKQTKGRGKRPLRKRGTGLPKLSRQKANENRSRPLFALAIHPWPFEDSRHDYGIDGEVQITRPDDGGGGYEVTGKRCLVQLKSTDGKVPTGGRPVPARIKVMHVRNWTESGLPVLLARCHLSTKRFFWRWVDDRFVAELSQTDPAWMGRDELTVHLPGDSKLDAQALTGIQAYVSKYRRTASLCRQMANEKKTYGTEHSRVCLTVKEAGTGSAVFLALEPAEGRASEAIKEMVGHKTLWLRVGTYAEGQELASVLSSRVDIVGMLVEHDRTGLPN